MRIAIYLDAITGGFETDLVRAQKISARAFKEIKKEAAEANKRLGNVFAGAIAASAAGFAFAVKKGVDHMDDLSKAAQRAGTSTEFMSGLEYQAKLADVSLDGLQGAIKKLSVNMAEAQAKNGEMRDLFKTTLGVDVENADGSLRDMSEVFPEIADRMANMRDGSEKVALAIKLFGRAGADLIPLLNDGAEGFRAAYEEAEKFGLIVSTQAGRDAEAFNDNLTRLASVAQGAGLELAKSLLRPLSEVTDLIVDTARDPAFQEDFGNAIRAIGEAAIAAVKGTSQFVNMLKFLHDEWRQFKGDIDDDDVTRWSDELAAARDALSKLKGEQAILPDPGEQWATPIVLRVDTTQIAAAEKRVKDLEAKVDEANARTLAKVAADQHAEASQRARDVTRQFSADSRDLFQTVTPPPRLPDSGAAKEREKAAKQLAKLRLEALGEEEQGVEQLKQKYAELDALLAQGAANAADAAKQRAEIRAGLAQQLVEPLRDAALTDEERQVKALQLEFTKLNNLVAAGALSREEADRIGARYAEDWRDAEQQKITQFELAAGVITEQEAAVRALNEQFKELQRTVDAGVSLPPGVPRLDQETADRLKAVMQAKFEQAQKQENRDEYRSLGSGLLQQGEYDLSPMEQRFAAEREATQQHFDELQEQILTSTKLTEDQRTDLMIRSAEARQAALADVDKQQAQGQIDMWASAFGNLSALMQTHNTKLFNIGKAAAIAEAAIKIPSMVLDAYEEGGPYIGPILAATVAAAGAVQIANIMNAEPPAYDEGGDIPAGKLGWVAERGNEILTASREPTLLTKPTLVMGPAHVTSRRDTEQLLRDREKFAGMFDEGGRIPAGSYGMVAEKKPELLRADGVAMPAVSRASRQEPQRMTEKHIHVWSEEEAANQAASSKAWERVIIHHVNRNRKQIPQF